MAVSLGLGEGHEKVMEGTVALSVEKREARSTTVDNRVVNEASLVDDCRRTRSGPYCTPRGVEGLCIGL